MLLQFSPKGEYPIAEPPDGVVIRQIEVSDLASVVAPRLVRRRGSAVSISFLEKSFLGGCFLAMGGSAENETLGLSLVQLENHTPCIVLIEGRTPLIQTSLLKRTLSVLWHDYEFVFSSDWRAVDFLEQFGFEQVTSADTVQSLLELAKLEVAARYLGMEQPGKAEAYLESSSSAFPGEVREWNIRREVAQAYLHQGRLDEAAEVIGTLPEGMRFRLNFTRGAQQLVWLDRSASLEAGTTSGEIIAPSQLAYLTPLIFEVFGDEESWLKRFHKNAIPDCCVALKLDGKWAGCCLVGGELPSIWSIGVLPQWRGRGYARGLLNHSLKLLRETSHKVVRAHIHPNNKPSLAFFRSAGFQFVNSTADFMKMAATSGRVYRSDFRSLNLNPDEVEEACRDNGIEILDRE